MKIPTRTEPILVGVPTPDGTRSRNEFLDVTKGFLIFLVVYGHVIQYIGYNNTGFLVDPVFKGIYLFHMPPFMAISGYVSFNSIQKSSFFGLIGRRVQTLYFPVLFWSTLIELSRITTGIAGHIGWSQAYELLLIILSRTGRYWFIVVLFESIVCVSFLKTIGFRTQTSLLAACLAAYLIPFQWLNSFKVIFPFFCLGYLLAGAGLPTFYKKPFFWPMLFLACFPFHMWWDRYNPVILIEANWESVCGVIFRTLCGLVSSAVALGGVWYAYKRIHSKVLITFVALLGKNTLDIYIVHFSIINLLVAFPFPSKGTSAFSFTMAPILALLITGLCISLALGVKHLPIIKKVFSAGR